MGCRSGCPVCLANTEKCCLSQKSRTPVRDFFILKKLRRVALLIHILVLWEGYCILQTMTKETLVFFIGIILTLVPFLGNPEDWKQYAVASVGALLILIGYMQSRHTVSNLREYQEMEPKSE